MNTVLMVRPDFFNISYAINPYMTDENRSLNKVDLPKARNQWDTLKSTYERLGFQVTVLDGHPELPDMVFAANQSFPFLDPTTQEPSVLLSNMRSDFRKPEVAYFKLFYEQNGYKVYTLEDKNLCIEGNGDALIQPESKHIWGGYGPRTDKKVYEELTTRFDLSITPLELIDKNFYHLDTCFSILNAETVAIQMQAFSEESLRQIKRGFKTIIEVDYQENLKFFCCNCHSPNGKDVILQNGSVEFKAKLIQNGFTPHEVNTSEFMKAGGSVFCLKMMLF